MLLHPTITSLPPPAYDEWDDGQRIFERHKETLHEDARNCFFWMVAPAPHGIQADTTSPCFEYIAAALSILCGYFRHPDGKREGKPNFAAAAAGVGKPTKHPEQGRKWVVKLQKLEAKLVAVDRDTKEQWRMMACERRRVWDHPGTSRFKLGPRIRKQVAAKK